MNLRNLFYVIRWHISLGTWFKDYIYFPMGGSRVDQQWKLYRNLFVVWILTGIWHGANWNYVFWGFVYFILISIEKALKLPERLKSSVLKAVYRVFTLMIVVLQWVIFNADSLKGGLTYLKHMFLSHGGSLANYRTLVLLQEYGLILTAGILFAMPVVPKLKEAAEVKNTRFSDVLQVPMAAALAVLFLIAVSFSIADQNNPFLYGNF